MHCVSLCIVPVEEGCGGRVLGCIPAVLEGDLVHGRLVAVEEALVAEGRRHVVDLGAESLAARWHL